MSLHCLRDMNLTFLPMLAFCACCHDISESRCWQPRKDCLGQVCVYTLTPTCVWMCWSRQSPIDVCSTSQVRQELQRLPGAPAQTSRLFSLHAKAAELKQKAADMEARAVPRPEPPQYGPLWQNVHRFLNGLGSQERMTHLLGRLMVSKGWHLVICAIIRCICSCPFVLALPLCNERCVVAPAPYMIVSFASLSECLASAAYD